MINWFSLTLDRKTQISQPCPNQSFVSGGFFGHLVEQAFDAGKSVLASHIMHQLMQEFPFGAGVASRLDGFQESLDPPFDICKSASFLRMSATRQKEMSQFGGLIGQDT